MQDQVSVTFAQFANANLNDSMQCSLLYLTHLTFFQLGVSILLVFSTMCCVLSIHMSTYDPGFMHIHPTIRYLTHLTLLQ